MTSLLAALLLAASPSPAALELLSRHECHRCHVVEGLAPLPAERDCRGCHVDISTAASRPDRDARGRAEFGDAWPTFIERTGRHFVHVPSLVGLDRFRASWLRDFLRAPYDLRPALEESMLRHALTPAEIDVLVREVGARPDTPHPPPDATRLRLGGKLYDNLACATCHRFGARDPSPEPTPLLVTRALAPDLRHARDRLDRTTVVAWIRNPRALKSDTLMPPYALPDDAIESLADFILHTPVETTRAPPAPPPAPLVVTTHRDAGPAPTYEEVERAVFHETCWHCHSDVDPATGDGEPGNTGGFGFPAAGLSFESYASLRRGSVGPDGKRRSILKARAGEESILVARLRQRFVENQRDLVRPGHDPGPLRTDAVDTTPRGMPLGLPAISPAQLQLVERWVAAGAPGPKHTGKRKRPSMAR